VRLESYTGFGSRRTPCHRFPLLREIASELEALGYVLRSGGADGADIAFESGVKSLDAKQIFYPDGSVPCAAFDLAEQHHPAWSRCSAYARRCHARNCMQVLGAELNDPSAFGVCWTPGAREVGGSAQAMRIARAFDVQVYNVADEKQLAVFLQSRLPLCLHLATK
jgi:hypothetical protein